MAKQTVKSRPPRIDFGGWLLGGEIVQKPIRSTALVLHEKASQASKVEGKVPLPKKEAPNANVALQEVKAIESSKVADTVTAAAKADTAENPSPSAWTKTQDKTILSMKKANKTWADIGSATKRSKKDVQTRHKELVAMTETDTEYETDSENEKATSNDKLKSALKKLKDSKDEKANKQGSKNDAEKNQVGPAEDQPPKGKLQADGIWTKEDCETLELLESRYREQKWLQLQAGFYNMTGRMVSAELIRGKFGV